MQIFCTSMIVWSKEKTNMENGSHFFLNRVVCGECPKIYWSIIFMDSSIFKTTINHARKFEWGKTKF